MGKRRKGNNKVFAVLLTILIVCFILLGFAFYKYFYAGIDSNKYGNRLNGIEEYSISENLDKEIMSLYDENSGIENINVNMKGRIIYLTFVFNKALSSTDAQNVAVKSLEAIGEDNLTFYDIQYILTLKEDDDNEYFPMFGSKRAQENKVVW